MLDPRTSAPRLADAVTRVEPPIGSNILAASARPRQADDITIMYADVDFEVGIDTPAIGYGDFDALEAAKRS